jgi:hypothetical protein
VIFDIYRKNLLSLLVVRVRRTWSILVRSGAEAGVTESAAGAGVNFARYLMPKFLSRPPSFAARNASFQLFYKVGNSNICVK